MDSIASHSGARWLFAVSILARLPLAMLSIALLVHAEHLTGSFAAAGAVAGIYAAALGVGGPLLGTLADRRSGLMAARRSRSGRRGPGLVAILAALTLGHLALVPAAGSMVALGAARIAVVAVPLATARG